MQLFCCSIICAGRNFPVPIAKFVKCWRNSHLNELQRRQRRIAQFGPITWAGSIVTQLRQPQCFASFWITLNNLQAPVDNGIFHHALLISNKCYRVKQLFFSYAGICGFENSPSLNKAKSSPLVLRKLAPNHPPLAWNASPGYRITFTLAASSKRGSSLQKVTGSLFLLFVCPKSGS